MCDHCRSANSQLEKRMMGNRAQEKAAAFTGSRLEKPIVGDSRSAEWREGCCGGGCCKTKHNEIMPNATRAVDQSQLRQQRNSMYCTGNVFEPVASSRIADNTDSNGRSSSGHYPMCRINMSREFGGPSTETGVCPAMMRNLPCTSYREAKCFGGDCCGADTDSECSV